MQKSLDDITDADLEEISKMAVVFFTPKEIAMVLEVDVNAFIEACNTEGDKCYTAFMSGRLKSEYELRLSVVKLAKQGSSPAQTMSLEMLKQSQMKMFALVLLKHTFQLSSTWKIYSTFLNHWKISLKLHSKISVS